MATPFVQFTAPQSPFGAINSPIATTQPPSASTIAAATAPIPSRHVAFQDSVSPVPNMQNPVAFFSAPSGGISFAAPAQAQAFSLQDDYLSGPLSAGVGSGGIRFVAPTTKEPASATTGAAEAAAASVSAGNNLPPVESLDDMSSFGRFGFGSFGASTQTQQAPVTAAAPAASATFDLFSPPRQRLQQFSKGALGANTSIIGGARSPTQVDPFYDQQTQNMSMLGGGADAASTSGNWVTIFGFPPAQTSYILKKFGAIGEILQHRVTDGNYIHVMYAKSSDAQKALSWHAKILDGSKIMVGVVECIDDTIVSQQFGGVIPEQPLFSPRVGRSCLRSPTTMKRKYKSISDSDEGQQATTSAFAGFSTPVKSGAQPAVDFTLGKSSSSLEPPEKKRAISDDRQPQPQRSWMSLLSDYLFKF